MTKYQVQMEFQKLFERKKEDPFLKLVKKLRNQAKENPPTLEEITEEVERVRTERYAKKKRLAK